VLFFSKFASM